MNHTILLVDDDVNNLTFYKSFLEEQGWLVHQAESAKFAASLVQLNPATYSVALIDYHMPEIMGDELISWLKRLDPGLQILSITGDDSTEAMERNIASGASAIFHRSRGTDALLSIVRSFCERYQRNLRSIAVCDGPMSEKEKFISKFGMIGASESLFLTCQLIERYAEMTDAVLIQGENGTGKEQVARAVHQYSKVKTGPFIAVNCAALSEGLLESELFGHVKGAFTGAHQDRMGFFRQAQGGTLFLDEIGEMPAAVQAKLLRALQEKEVTPVGAQRPVRVNVRIITATNVDLAAAVKSGRFREDLYYRLNVLPIQLHPLRQRLDDIEPLTKLFISKWNKRSGASKSVRADVVQAFQKYSWPGNVRELENTIYRILARASATVLTLSDLDPHLQQAGQLEDFSRLSYEGLKAKHQKEEREFLEAQLKVQGSISRTAARLKIAKTTLYERLKFLGLHNRQAEN